MSDFVLLCDVDIEIDQGDHHWLIGCVRDVDHDGPHQGIITWEGVSS